MVTQRSQATPVQAGMTSSVVASRRQRTSQITVTRVAIVVVSAEIVSQTSHYAGGVRSLHVTKATKTRFRQLELWTLGTKKTQVRGAWTRTHEHTRARAHEQEHAR